MRLLGDSPCEGNGLLRPAESAGHQGAACLSGAVRTVDVHCPETACKQDICEMNSLRNKC
jgi:hypothetical protein